MAENNNYVVGRGSIFFSPFFPDTFTPSGEDYFGNTPSLEQTAATTDLKHYSSEAGLKVQDASVTLERNITLQFGCDNISIANLAKWWGADQSVVNQAATSGAAITENFNVAPGKFYQVGVTDNNPLGLSNLASATYAGVEAIKASGTYTFTAQPAANDTVTIAGQVITFVAGAPGSNQVQIGGNFPGTAQALLLFINADTENLGVTASGSGAIITLSANVPGAAGNAITTTKSSAGIAVSGATLAGGSAGASAALVEGVDINTDLDGGRFEVIQGGNVAPNSVITISYQLAEAVAAVIVSNELDLYGTLRFVADNPVGENTDYFYPYVKLSSNGNFSLKGDAWQEMTFSAEVLKLPNRQRVYARQRPGTNLG